jgi:DNA-binding LacI/PurR family transcriptional regulator
MADVARLAGVSQQTVSRVVNESDDVRPETRARVQEAMRMLDYRPNSLARALATGRSQTVGVIIAAPTQHGPASTLFGVERAAHAAGYHISIVAPHVSDRRATLDAAARLRAQGVEGILVIAPRPQAARGLCELPTDVAVVAVEADPEGGVPSVAVDNVLGGELATRHLLELGHRDVWHLAGPEDWSEAHQRVAGWRGALRAASVPAPPLLQGDWTARTGYALGARLLEHHPEVTAVFTANDQLALGLLRRLHEAGREVPGALSVVGFDDLPESAYFNPPLTTIRQDFIEIGRRSVAVLLATMGGQERSSLRETIAPKLVVRASTAPFRP